MRSQYAHTVIHTSQHTEWEWWRVGQLFLSRFIWKLVHGYAFAVEFEFKKKFQQCLHIPNTFQCKNSFFLLSLSLSIYFKPHIHMFHRTYFKWLTRMLKLVCVWTGGKMWISIHLFAFSKFLRRRKWNITRNVELILAFGGRKIQMHT